MRFLMSAVFLFLASIEAFTQSDSLSLKNGDIVVGEIKSLDHGVVTIETSYSDSDFKIEWDGIRRISTETYFLISFTDANPIYGKLTSSSDSTINIISDDDHVIEFKFDEIVLLVQINDRFKDRFSAAIDIGYSLAKANNLQQFTSNSMIGYKAEKWSSEASYNTLLSMQDDTDTIQRTETGIIFRYLFYRKWYISASVSLYSNSEQKLDFRNNTKIGLGKYLIHTNRSHWGLRLGVNRNLERFSNETPDRNSWETYMGTEVDLFDIGDLNLFTNFTVYRSITEAQRWRAVGTFDAKYDLPLDFYIKASISINYDNQPANDASEVDYLLQTGFGWEW